MAYILPVILTRGGRERGPKPGLDDRSESLHGSIEADQKSLPRPLIQRSTLLSSGKEVRSTLRATGRHDREVIDRIAESVAGKLDSTAAYGRSPDVEGALITLRRVIRPHPGASLLLVALPVL